MGIFSKKSKMDSRERFLEIIRTEYTDLIDGKVDKELIDAVSEGVTDYYYEQYQRFRKEHPKSIERYSSFQLKDLNHPSTHELIIKIVIDEVGNDYEDAAGKFLNMTFDELKKFEQNREDFNNMF